MAAGDKQLDEWRRREGGRRWAAVRFAAVSGRFHGSLFLPARVSGSSSSSRGSIRGVHETGMATAGEWAGCHGGAGVGGLVEVACAGDVLEMCWR
jgi:hypothetical protein